MDLYLKIATQLQNFFKYDLIYLPIELQGKIIRIEVQLPELEPLNWLGRQQSAVKTYWSDRQSKFTMAGVGELDLITGDRSIDYPAVFTQLRKNLSPLFPQVRYYGGVSFSQDQLIDPHWQLFGNYRFVVPKFEVWTNGLNTFFACNFTCDFRADRLDLILQELAQLDFDLVTTSRDLPAQIDRIDTPTQTEWAQNIDTALAKFTTLNLDKIVLARRSILTFTHNLHPQSLLQSLQPNNAHS